MFTDGRLHNGSRMIQPNHMFDTPRHDLSNYRQFTDNSITTTKYSLLTFIPHNIFYQMCNKYANMYFLFIAVLNFCPLFGSYTKFLGLVPISFVLGTTLIKDGFEDIRRWRYDNKINTKTCHVWDRDRQMFRKMQWKHIIVGDFVHVSNEQEIPADVLFLRSSSENASCFVETCNLDGETSLKQRVVPRQYVSFSQQGSDFTPTRFNGTIFCEPPDPAIYTIRAKIEYQTGYFEIITKDNMLLRGSRLRNTTFIEGIVLYAGSSTL
uniref:PhoLip_ATPase_N domain-containing protein n=1 Tax=Angiostrongylus cantonensis TaxID=6313 RepID=A0A158PBP6_ANGCA